MELSKGKWSHGATLIFTQEEKDYISKNRIYVRQKQPTSGRVASALWVACALTVRQTFFLIPCAWCLPTHLSPLPCTQRTCCGRPPSRHPPHPFPLLLLSSDGIRRTPHQFPAPGQPAPNFSLRRPTSALWHLKSSGSFRRGRPRATFIFSYRRTTPRGITIVILFLFTTVVLSTNCI